MEGLNQGLSVRRPQVEQLRDEKESGFDGERKRCTCGSEQRAQWEVVEMTVEVVGGWRDVDGWVRGEV